MVSGPDMVGEKLKGRGGASWVCVLSIWDGKVMVEGEKQIRQPGPGMEEGGGGAILNKTLRKKGERKRS